MSEDCLFLDVYVPEKIFESAQGQLTGVGAPILLWIFGGGYVFGSKEYWGDPGTLIKSSLDDHSEGIIFISINYRVSKAP